MPFDVGSGGGGDVVYSRKKDVLPGTSSAEGATAAQRGLAPVKLVAAPGVGADPWENAAGVKAPSPLTGTPPQPSTKSNLVPDKIQAARGVIGTIRQQAALQGIPAAIALAVAKEESGYNQEAVSSAGAIGIMQLEPGTAQGLGVDPNNWKQNIRGGVHYLAEKYKQYGNWDQALQAYNGGDGNVGSQETQGYANTVQAIAQTISNGSYKPSGGSSGVVTISAPLPGSPLVTSGFGPRSNPMGGGGDFHDGVDLAAPQGTPIHAMIGGTVTFSGYDSGAGNMVTIKDKAGRLWNYFHMVQPSPTRVGEKISAGNQIGNVGTTGMSTGPHLDIHLMVNGSYVNPMAIIRKAYKAGWGKTANTYVSTTDMIPPGAGGVNGSGGSAGGDQGYLGAGVVGQNAQPAQSVDAAVVPGGQTAIPSNAAAWQRILSSGPVSPETKNLAERAGVMTQQPAALAEVYNNPGPS